MRTRLATTILFSSLLLGGCLRYVPSRAELARSGRAEGAEGLGGPEEFHAFDRAREEGLRRLIDDRSALIGGSTAGVNGSYRIGTGDVLSLEVFGLDELKADLEVSPAGTISPALVGEVGAASLTIAELSQRLTDAYRTYVVNPQVRLSVKEFRSSAVSVVGAVEKPGLYPLKRNGMALSDILAAAGGRTELAGSQVILIPAPGSPGGGTPAPYAGGPTVMTVASPPVARRGIEIDIEDLYGSAEKAPVVIPLTAGDTISVPEAGTVEVDGEVAKPGSYKLSSRLSGVGAVAAAGGLTYSADVNNVEVIRDFGSGRKAVEVLDLEKVALNGQRDIRLRNGDVVRVPSEAGKFAKRQVVEMLNGVFRFGVTGQAR